MRQIVIVPTSVRSRVQHFPGLMPYRHTSIAFDPRSIGRLLPVYDAPPRNGKSRSLWLHVLIRLLDPEAESLLVLTFDSNRHKLLSGVDSNGS